MNVTIQSVLLFTVNTIILSFHSCSSTPCHSIFIKCNIEPPGEYVMISFKNLDTTNHQFRNKAMTECTSACWVGLGDQTWSTGASGLHNEWPSVCISLSQAVIIVCLLSPAVIALIKDVGSNLNPCRSVLGETEHICCAP